MLRNLPKKEETPPELRQLVKISVNVLGKVIADQVGPSLYRQVEAIRKRMSASRGKSERQTLTSLRLTFKELERLAPPARLKIARSFTLMLELTNVCENAYRSHRLSAQAKSEVAPRRKPKAIVYVLTAHPTEARSPENIAVFRLIQEQLIGILGKSRTRTQLESDLYHLLSLAWQISVTRQEKPGVGDEAKQIYATLLEPRLLDRLLETSHEILPVYIRSWVGGDKDGHPGVDEKMMRLSLRLSRDYLRDFVGSKLSEIMHSLELLGLKPLRQELQMIHRSLRKMKLGDGDGARIKKLRAELSHVSKLYARQFGSLHPALTQLKRLLHVFPGLVVPLELREASDVLLSNQTRQSPLTIDRMLRALAAISRGGEPRWYVRSFVISMASELEHLKVADRKISYALGRGKLPVVPLFEQADALLRAPEIVKQWIDDPRLGADLRRVWRHRLEMMVGYSDSSKESGVLPSRLAIADAMHRLERLCKKEKMQAVFFQGSGGSTDRGGGTVRDQTAWWPKAALNIYKVTIQGEMVERSLATPEIMRGQILKIAQSAGESLARRSTPPKNLELSRFAESIAAEYRSTVRDPGFLSLIRHATPYSHVGELNIGSRPASRSKELSVKGLRAIPWVLCWTQTRVLFPTWWGVGTSWRKLKKTQRVKLRRAFFSEPVFASYVRALGFTLAKVELPVWRIYLEKSGLERSFIDATYARFQDEVAGALEMVRFISGERDPLWFRHWLGASIRLRAPMIHPLNLLQILASQDKDYALFRVTVTGISSGMMTTG